MKQDITSWKADEGTGSLDLAKVPMETLFAALRKQGYYPLVVVSAEDVMNMMMERDEPCTWQEADFACHEVWWKGEYGDDYMAALEYACEVLQENREGPEE